MPNIDTITWKNQVYNITDSDAARASHTHTANDVGARPNTWIPTAAEVGARPNTWVPTAADVGAAPSNHNQAATTITGTTAIATAGVKQIYAGTQDMTPGTTPLADGVIYLVYE